MASVTGSRLAFFSSTVTADKVNVVLTADGVNAVNNDGIAIGSLGSQTVAGGFNVEVFTTAAGSLAAGYQASAFIQGAIKLSNNVAQAGSPTSTEQLLAGSYSLTDLSGGSSPNESIQIVGTNGDSYVVVGSAGDTITGSANSKVQQFIDASGTNKNANPGPFPGPETVIGGAGGTTVAGGKGDLITGGAGALQVNDGSGAGGETVKGGAGNLSVFAIGKGFSITGSTGGTTFIDDTYGTGGGSSIVGGSGTGVFLAGTNTFIFAEKGDKVTVGSATSAVVAAAGTITVTGGDGTTTGAFGSAFNTVMLTGKNDLINLGAAPSFVDAFTLPSTGTTITGGSGFDVVLAGAGVSIVGGTGVGANLTAAIPIAGAGTVTGGKGDLLVFDIGKGETVTGSSAGTTFINDAYGIGGNSNLTGGGGATTIIGAAGDTITGGAGATNVNAFAGSETVTAGAGATTVQSGKGDSITGGTGALQVFLNDDKGDATVSLGAGHGKASIRDISVKGASTAQDSVTGFATGTDIIQSKSSVDAGGKFLGTSASDGKGGTTLTFLDGQKITLAGVADPTKITFTQ